MKRVLSVALAMVLCLSLVFSLGVPARAAGGVAVNSTNFPDANFRSIVANSVDPNKDGVLTDAEIAQITVINVPGEEIKSLKGVEYFTALEDLDCADNDITALDLRCNTALKQLRCHENPIKSLDLMQNTALEEIFCYYCELESLAIGNKPALRVLSCPGNELDTLNVSQSPELEELYTGGNDLGELDVTNCPKLRSLDCNNNVLEELDPSGCPALRYLSCSGNELKDLDLSCCPKLEEVNCSWNVLQSLVLEGCRELQALYCHDNNLQGLWLSWNPKLARLECYGNLISSVDLRYCPRLSEAVETSGPMSYELGDRPEKLYQYTSSGSVYSILADKFTTMSTGVPVSSFYFPSDDLLQKAVDADMNGDGKLSWLEGNQVTNMDLAGRGESFNSLEGLEYFTGLTWLDVSDNGLTELDLSFFPDLITVNAWSNHISKADVTSCKALETLNINNNCLTKLDVTQNDDLRVLNTALNDIRVLDISNNPILLDVYDQGSYQGFTDPGTGISCNRWILGSSKLTVSATTNLRTEPLTAPVITTQPKSVTANEGKEVSFSIDAEGMELTYQWQYKKAGSSTWNNSTSTGNQFVKLTLNATEARNGMQFRCIVKNDAGTAISSVVTLTVNLKPRITTQPSNKTAAVGENVKFTVAASGTDLNYQWQYKKAGSSTWYNSTSTGNKTKTLTVEATEARNGMQFRCKVTNAAGTTTSNAATLTVQSKPVITTQPASKSAAVGENVKFTVAASGSGLNYQWQYKKAGSSTWYNSTSTGNKTKTLTVEATTARSGMQFRCKVTNAAGTATSSAATLTVVTKPAITTQPKSASAAYGESVKFTVKATGGNLSYQWQYQKSGSSTWNNSTSTGNKTATLTVEATAARNGMKFRCKVTNAAGTATSSAVTLTTAEKVKPAITTQPSNKTAAAGSTAKFTVKATGGDLSYQWQYKKAGSSTWYNSTSTGNKTATLTVEATAARNGMQFRCIVKNSLGTATSNAAKLTVT